jgi:transcriptional regulator with XRE-family HTH domain
VDIYDRIRQIIEGLGLTPYAFARRMHTQPGVVYAWLSRGGQRGFNISPKKIQQIVETYGVSREWLERGEGEAPDFTAGVEDVTVEGGDDALSHIDRAEQALRAGRVIDAHEHLQSARRALAA